MNGMVIEHSIDVGSHPPIKQASRRVPVAFASEEENVIKQMEALGIIRKSTSHGLVQSVLCAKCQER